MINGQNFSLVCLCHTPPSSSCIVSIQSRFHLISLRMSGIPLPLSGMFSLIPGLNISQAHSRVPVVIPELTTYRP